MTRDTWRHVTKPLLRNLGFWRPGSRHIRQSVPLAGHPVRLTVTEHRFPVDPAQTSGRDRPARSWCNGSGDYTPATTHVRCALSSKACAANSARTRRIPGAPPPNRILATVRTHEGRQRKHPIRHGALVTYQFLRNRPKWLSKIWRPWSRKAAERTRQYPVTQTHTTPMCWTTVEPTDRTIAMVRWKEGRRG